MNATSKANPVQPWISWEDTHFGFSTVLKIPGAAWRSSEGGPTIELTRWMSVVGGLLFFAFFGFAEEARKHYNKAVGSVCSVIGVQNPFSGTKSRSFGLSSSFGNSPSSTLTGSGSSGLNWAKLKISIPGTGGNASNAALPIYVEKEVIKKRDSMDTLSDFMSVLSSGGQSDLLSVKGKPQGLTPISGPSPYNSTVSSRAGSPTGGRPRPKIEIGPVMYPKGSLASTSSPEVFRTPESAFPRPVTPSSMSMREGPSFLEMQTPATPSSLASSQDQRQRSDNWV
jgi:pheromone a factor receptor